MCGNLGGLFINLHRADIPHGGKHSSSIPPVYVVVHVVQLNTYSLYLYNLLVQASKGATLKQSFGSLYASPLSPGLRGASLRPIKLSTLTSHVPFSPRRCGKQEMDGDLHLKPANSSTLAQTLDGTV